MAPAQVRFPGEAAMIPGLGRPVASVAEIEALKADPANKGRTFEVTRDVLDHFARRL